MGKNYANAQKMKKMKKISGGKIIDSAIAKHLFSKDQTPTEVQSVEDWLKDGNNKITICKSKAKGGQDG